MFEPKATASHLDSTRNRHAAALADCPVLREERTCRQRCLRTAFDPGQTSGCRSTTAKEATSSPLQYANLSPHDRPPSARNRCAVTNSHDLARTEESRFRGALDDVIIIPLVFVTLAANKILRFILAVLIRLLDYAFPLAMQIVWLPLFTAKLLGNVIVTIINGALRFFPLSETKRRQWSISIRRNWSWLRRKISYRAFEQAVHIAFEGGMAWVFRQCRHLTPNTALLAILGAVLWLPFSFATAMHAVLFAKVTSWPAWTQLLHPLATVIAKSKLLVLPVYPAAWPQAKKHPFVQLVFKSYETIQSLHVIKKVGFRYQQAEIAGIAAVERLERTAGLASAMRWLREAHVAEQLGVEKPTQKLRSFFSRWSIKFSAEYYEAKERQA